MVLMMAGCTAKDKNVELPEISEIETVQYNSIKIPVERLDTENIMDLIQDLESLQPLRGDHTEKSAIYDTISLIYKDGSKDVFLFWKENDNWYVETLEGDIYENADFVQDYINYKEIDAEPDIILPDMFLIKFFSDYGNGDNYNVLPELTNCLIQGYSLEQAAEITEAKVMRDEILYQYAVIQNISPADEELQGYISNIIDGLRALPNYTDLENALTESGTNIEKEIEKRNQIIRKELSIQRLYNNKYDDFRCGRDTIEETVYWDFGSYWNAFVEKTVLTQQLSDTTDIEIQITEALEYITSNKEILEEGLGIVITL